MNTDNMSILGLTIDYGPYGWLEPFELDWTPNITDAQGRRYRFGNQPGVAHWNLAQLARALAPLVGELEPLRKTLDDFPKVFSALYRHTMLRKLGLCGHRDTERDDNDLLTQLGEVMVATKPDYTLFFRLLQRDVDQAFYAPLEPAQRELLDAWLRKYRARNPENADAINPLYVPRNYLVQEVIDATERGERKAVLELLDVLRRPYDEQPGRQRFAAKRPEWARDRPGCSMLSCSS